MASDSHTGRWIKDPEGLQGLVRERATGVYYVRRNFSRGPGLPAVQKLASLQTKSRAEAVRRFATESARLQVEVERMRRDADGARTGRPKTEATEDEARFWRRAFANAADDAAYAQVEATFGVTIEERLGDPVRSEVDPYTGEARPVYDPKREAAALALSGLVSGQRVPVDFHLDAFLGSRERTVRYDLRIRRAVRELGAWLAERPEGNSVRAVTKRTAAHFTDHLAQTLKPHTLKGLKSSLSLYWDWMAAREEVASNPWKEVKLDKRLGKSDARAFTDEEMLTLLKGTTDQTMLDFIRFGALTGMRENEIGRLTVKDTEGGWFDIKKGKTLSSVRRVPIHPDLVAIVERRTKDRAPADWLFDDLPPSNGKGRERADKMGERFTAYRRSVGVDERPADGGRSNVVFHSFRHWFTTAALNAGAMQPVVSTLVGHAEGLKGMTLGTYYSGPTKQLLIDAVAGVRLPTKKEQDNA